MLDAGPGTIRYALVLDDNGMMLDEGTKTRDALTVARDMEALGTSLGSDMGRDGCSLGARVLKRNARAMLGARRSDRVDEVLERDAEQLDGMGRDLSRTIHAPRPGAT